MIRIFHHYVSRMAFILVLMELVLLFGAGGVAMLLWGQAPARFYIPAGSFAALILLSMAGLGLYQQQVREDARAMMLRLLPAMPLGFALHAALAQLLPGIALGKAGGLALLTGGCGVLLVRVLLHSSAHSTMLTERLIVVGEGQVARECLELAARTRGLHRFEVIGCVPVHGDERCVPASVLLRGGDSLLALARRHNAHEVIVSVGDRRSGGYPVRELLECTLGGVRVTDAASFFEREASQIRVDSVQPSFLIFGGGFDQSFARAAVKRAFDLSASAAIFTLAMPVMLAAAVCILLEDGGPVMFRQQRVGKDGKLFEVLKFRSMRTDAERDGQPRWASAADPRVTRSGTWLRKLRIDELPQMVNVFRGEMSFVGPRPERAYFVEQLSRQIPYYDIRHSIKPGITGLAQVRYQYGATVDDAVCKLQYDLYYVKNNSLFLDLLILIETIQVVLFGKGAR